MPAFEYRKSSYSDYDNECVEIATNILTTVAIRDSKDAEGSSIRMKPDVWSRFQAAIKGGGFGLTQPRKISPLTDLSDAL